MIHQAGIFIPLALLIAQTAIGQTSAPAASRPAAALGFQGVWYQHEPGGDDPEPAFSGGLATFSSCHTPMAIHVEQARKTFFVYGGSAGTPEDRRLQICISVYDHGAGTVMRPRVLVERASADPHGNPALSIDGQGCLWVFAPGVPAGQPGDVFRSARPYDLSEFTRAARMTFADPQPWFIDGKGFLVLLTRRSDKGTELCFVTSPDGGRWSEPAALTPPLRGCRAVSWRHRGKVGVAFNFHPDSRSLGGNPYYLETPDAGQTWTTAQREKLTLPVRIEDSPTRVFDYASGGQAVCLKDLNFDSQSNPNLLLLMSRGPSTSPQGGPFLWMIARWATRSWRMTGLIESDHLMDSGCLHIETRNSWRLLGPTAPGAEPRQPGGEIVAWFSDDFGRAWGRTDLTHASDFNHNGVRRPLDAHAEFYGFWADGAVRRASESLLYFTTRDGKVFRLPTRMSQDIAQPELVSPPIGATQPASQASE